MRRRKRLYGIVIAMFCFLGIISQEKLMAQVIRVPIQSVDTSKLMHHAENELLFRTLLAIDYILRDTTSNQKHQILLECAQAEADILNDWCQGNKQGSLQKHYREPVTPWFDTYWTILSNQYGNLTKSQRQRLRNLHFQPTDYLLGINSTNEFKENILLALNDCFANITSKEIPITLRSIRSYAHYLEVSSAKNTDSDEVSESSQANATFSANGTFASVIDSLDVLDALASPHPINKRWKAYRNILTTYKKGYREWESSAGHLRRLIATAQSVPLVDDSLVTWLLESNYKGSNHWNMSRVINTLGLPIHRRSIHFTDKNSNLLPVITTDSQTVKMDFLNVILPFWGLADYNLNPIRRQLKDDSEVTDDDDNAGSISLPFGVIGVSAHQNMVDFSAFNRALTQNQLTSILSQSMGAEIGIRGPEMGYVLLQYSAQNQWLNWNSQPHYSNYHLLLSSFVPLIEKYYVQSYLGFDYQFSNHRYSTSVENVFIGNPSNKPIVWVNNAQLLGLSLRAQLRIASFYLAAQGAYRWDVSDHRWYHQDQPINSDDQVDFSGLYFSVSTGWIWGASR